MHPLPALFPHLEAFVRRAAREIATQGIPQRHIWTYTFGSAANFTGSQTPVADPSLALASISQRWSHWPEYLPVLQAVGATEGLSTIVLTDLTVAATPAHSDAGLDGFLREFATDYCNEARDVPGLWDENVFSKLYQALADSVERNGMRIAIWAPLFRVEAGGFDGGVELLDGHFLLEPDPLTRDRLRNPYSGVYPTNVAQYYLKASAVLTYGQPISFPSPKFDMCVSAIRLAAGGEARLGAMSSVQEPGDCRPMAMAGWSMLGWPEMPGITGGIMSVITPSDLPVIRKYAQLLPSIDQAFGVALRRFSLAAERMSGEDKLIDATIGLENLLLPGVDEELSFHFALRGAWLLGGGDATNRRKVYADLKRIYAVRSQVVHANAKAQKKLTAEVINGAIESLRQLLRLVLERGASRSSWRSLLDSAVLG